MEINLIPMIDIMLILLIFFMVATTIKHAEKALPIELPKERQLVDYIYEQPPEELLGTLLPRYLKLRTCVSTN